MRLHSIERDSFGQIMEMKNSFNVSENPDDRRNHDIPMYSGDGEQWGDTSNDLRDMQRLGKTQEFK